MAKSSVWSVSNLTDIYTENRYELIRRAEKKLRDRHLAEEIVQEALVKVVLASPEFIDTSHAKGYLFRAVDNLCIDAIRNQGRRPELIIVDSSTEDQLNETNQLDQSELLAAAEDAALIRDALSLLSPAERAALVMWEVDGRDVSEIAKELGINQKSVRQTLYRARKSFKRILTERIVDEEKGLTAFDLLSKTWSRASEVSKKSGKVILSAVVLIFGLFGFQNFGNISTKIDTGSDVTSIEQNVMEVNKAQTAKKSLETIQNKSKKSSHTNSDEKFLASRTSSTNARATELRYYGLDKFGIPFGLTITDNFGAMGELYISQREPLFEADQVQLSSIAKTTTKAAAILMNQTLTQTASGLGFDALVSYARNGKWVPLLTSVITNSSERLVNGNFLVSATIQVQSEVETELAIPATTNGRELVTAPSRLNVRIVLDPTKTKIVAEAVQVIERLNK